MDSHRSQEQREQAPDHQESGLDDTVATEREAKKRRNEKGAAGEPTKSRTEQAAKEQDGDSPLAAAAASGAPDSVMTDVSKQ